MVGAVRGLYDAELWTRFRIGSRHDPVEPLLIAIDNRPCGFPPCV